MMALQTLGDIEILRESFHVECKLALGRDGEGHLPENIWESYSAFANSDGGDIFLGLRELGPGRYELAGIPNPAKVVRELMTGLNDRRVVSANLLTVDDVDILDIDGRWVIRISVPKAPVYLRPVYLGTDPLTGTFVRSRDTDLRLNADRVRRIQARVRAALISRA